MNDGSWILNQSNTIKFFLGSDPDTPVDGLGDTFSLEIQKGTGAFAAALGTKGEISDGWYYYTSTAADANTRGEVAINAWGPGTFVQRLVYVVQARNAGCSEFTYTVTDSVSGDPISGVEIWISTDVTGNEIVWYGTTDSFGVARDGYGNKPCVDPGTYYVWKKAAGFIDDDNPDTEVVS